VWLQARRAAIDRFCLPAGPTAANPPHAVAAAQNGTEGQTDVRQFHRPCSAYCASNVSKNDEDGDDDDGRQFTMIGETRET